MIFLNLWFYLLSFWTQIFGRLYNGDTTIPDIRLEEYSNFRNLRQQYKYQIRKYLHLRNFLGNKQLCSCKRKCNFYLLPMPNKVSKWKIDISSFFIQNSSHSSHYYSSICIDFLSMQFKGQEICCKRRIYRKKLEKLGDLWKSCRF